MILPISENTGKQCFQRLANTGIKVVISFGYFSQKLDLNRVKCSCLVHVTCHCAHYLCLLKLDLSWKLIIFNHSQSSYKPL